MRGGDPATRLRTVSIDVTQPELLVPAGLVALWTAAGAVAGPLAGVPSVRAMRRRTLLLLALTTAAVAATGGALLASAPSAGPALPLLGLAALVTAGAAVPRIRRLGTAARAFAAAPGAPVSPALRAMAAHPLVGTPLHAAGAAAILALVSAAGGWRPDTPTAVALLGILTAAVWAGHGLRHSRLAEPALLPVRTVRTSVTRARAV
jgi:hypothetical protein